MAYTAYDGTHPDASSNGTTFATECRQNFAAMRDAVVLGVMKGWNYSVAGGTAEQPAELYLKDGTEWIKQAVTWGTTGGEAGNATVIVASYSANSGSAYDTIGTLTIAYDASGNVTSTTWS